MALYTVAIASARIHKIHIKCYMLTSNRQIVLIRGRSKSTYDLVGLNPLLFAARRQAEIYRRSPIINDLCYDFYLVDPLEKGETT